MNPHASGEIVVVWREGAWSCEFHPAGSGASRLVILVGERLVTVETTAGGRSALQRAEVLRQRVMRGDLPILYG